MAEPDAKKAKVEGPEQGADEKKEAKEDAAKEDVKEEDKATAEETPKEPEQPKELENDAEADSRAKVASGSVALNMADSTLNVLPVQKGKILMTLTEGGFQYLLSSTRANVGVKSGRYMFELKIVESLNPGEAQTQARTPQPRQLVRVGVSLKDSSLFLADGADNVCFDSEGFFVHDKNRKKASQKFQRGQTIALLLNLDEHSPNKNTISLFRNGLRIAEPQALPESFHGKTLYPTITYKNVTLQVNLGPAVLTPLPFKCRMLAEAAQNDVDVVNVSSPADGKHEVLFPVGLPEQGYFDWVDTFVANNPGYTELSDRKIAEWAHKSGIRKPALQPGEKSMGSNDKPDVKFGIPALDDGSVRKVLRTIAATNKRNYIIPELKSNLVPGDRKELLAKFDLPEFKKAAVVMMGEPNADYKAKVQALILGEKQQKAEADKKKKAQEEERKRLLEEKKRKAEEARKAKEAKQKKKEGKDVDEEDVEETKEEKKEDPPQDDDAQQELTDEEKALWYRKLDAPDITDRILGKFYANFSIPTTADGFDSVKFDWQQEAACGDLLKSWIMAKKLVQRVDDITPGEWFKSESATWSKTLSEWKKKQSDWKDPHRRKAMLAKKAEIAKKKKEEQKAANKTDEAADGEENKEAAEEEADKPMEIDMEELDVFAVEDVSDVGTGEPLFANFSYEDWTLLCTRFELHLLLHSFKKDLDDADRPSFSEEHLPFYYNKYFKKTFVLQNFGIEKIEQLIEMIKDTVGISEKSKFFSAALTDDTPIANFVKLTEDHRRERVRRIDAGDETASLKFTRGAPGGTAPSRGAPSAPPSQSRGSVPHAPQRDAPQRGSIRAQPPQPPPSRYGGEQSRHGGPSSGGSAYSSGQKRPQSPGPSSGYSGYGPPSQRRR